VWWLEWKEAQLTRRVAAGTRAGCFPTVAKKLSHFIIVFSFYSAFVPHL
jgi:hypothetical protein